MAGKGATSEYKEVSLGETCKRQRTSEICSEENLRLIPSLPDEISIQIFARVPRVCYFSMRLVARNWKAVVTNPELFQLRKELGMTEEWLYLLTKFEDDRLLWHGLDPLSKKWQRLPPIPNVVYEEESRKGLYGLWNMSESPYLLAGFHGKLHVITKDANRNVVVLQADVCNNTESFSTSSSSFLASSSDEHLESMTESETVVWKVITTTNFGSAELKRIHDLWNSSGDSDLLLHRLLLVSIE
ncbi:hypothetical protein TEA_005431 [Camellia sinensis var. sinensis]|uniref:F-box domain-containing protein n=1 Tax=Camellia sinensis var. sinensis TaxID=542762 RepID=A0A4S4DYQ5_CAMSN|nr:hypothetical protein TEA_005431 [Camellia sinensis var. sinensis]